MLLEVHFKDGLFYWDLGWRGGEECFKSGNFYFEKLWEVKVDSDFFLIWSYHLETYFKEPKRNGSFLIRDDRNGRKVKFVNYWYFDFLKKHKISSVKKNNPNGCYVLHESKKFKYRLVTDGKVKSEVVAVEGSKGSLKDASYEIVHSVEDATFVHVKTIDFTKDPSFVQTEITTLLTLEELEKKLEENQDLIDSRNFGVMTRDGE